MAEPARPLNNDNEAEQPRSKGPVRDNLRATQSFIRGEGYKKPGSPSLKKIEGGGESTPRKRGHLQAVPGPADLAQREKQPGQKTDNASPEAEKLDDLSGDGLYTENDTDEQNEAHQRKLRAAKKKRRRRLMIIGFGTGGLFGGLIGLLISLAPYKIENIIQNMKEDLFAAPEIASDQWASKLVALYLKHNILRGLGESSCLSTVDLDCGYVDRTYGSDSAIGRLFMGWNDKRLRLRLQDAGVEMIREGRNSPHYILRIRGHPDLNIPEHLTSDNTTADREFVEVIGGRAEMRDATRYIGEIAEFDNAITRYRLWGFMGRHFSVPGCIIACEFRDSVREWRQNNSRMARSYLINLSNRALRGFNEGVAATFACVLAGGCDQPDSYSSDGVRQDKLQRQLQEQLAELAEEALGKTVRELVDDADRMLRNGLVGTIVETIVTKVFNQQLGEQAGRLAGRIVPFIGWVDAAAEFLDRSEELVESAKKWFFIIKVGLMIHISLSYMTANDEMKSGNTDSDFVGSFVSSLGNKGNGGSAENSPLYQVLLGDNPISNALPRFIPSKSNKVFAQEADPGGAAGAGVTTGTYICNDGKPVWDHEHGVGDGEDGRVDEHLICPEDSLDTSAAWAAGIEYALNSNDPAMVALRAVRDIWNYEICIGAFDRCIRRISLNGTYDSLTDLAGSAIDLALRPFRNQIEGLIAPVIEGLMDWFVDNVVGSPLPDDLDDISGAKNLTMIAGGMEGMSYLTNTFNNGAKGATAEEMRDLQEERRNVETEIFAKLPLRQRLFDVTNHRSLLSRAAVIAPTNPGEAAQRTIAAAANPFATLARMVSSFMPKIAAQTVDPREDYYECDDPREFGGCSAFTVPPTHFPQEDIDAIPFDTEGENNIFEALTDEKCSEMNREWEGDIADDETDWREKDPDNGMDVYKRTNICKLNCSVTTGMGAMFSDATITQEENGQCGVTEDAGGGAAGPAGPGAECPEGVNPERHPTMTGYYQMPEAPNGEYNIYTDKRYGSLQLVCVLYNVGINYFARTNGAEKLQIGDLNASGHRSHNIGIAVDVSGKGATSAADNEDNPPPYSPENTILLGQLFLNTGIIHEIWWCGQGAVDHGFESSDGTMRAIRDYAANENLSLTTLMCLVNHYDHFHVNIQEQYQLGFWEP